MAPITCSMQDLCSHRQSKEPPILKLQAVCRGTVHPHRVCLGGQKKPGRTPCWGKDLNMLVTLGATAQGEERANILKYRLVFDLWT